MIGRSCDGGAGNARSRLPSRRPELNCRQSCSGSVTLDGFDGIDDGTAEAMFFEGSDATDRCAAW